MNTWCRQGLGRMASSLNTLYCVCYSLHVALTWCCVQGTHFSREHLVQLMAKQTGYWDVDSDRTSSLEALALEPSKAAVAAGVPSL